MEKEGSGNIYWAAHMISLEDKGYNLRILPRRSSMSIIWIVMILGNIHLKMCSLALLAVENFNLCDWLHLIKQV